MNAWDEPITSVLDDTGTSLWDDPATSPRDGEDRVVQSYTEWDPLEEVIVGVVSGATFPPWHAALEPVLPQNQHETFKRMAGQPFPAELVDAARNELDEFAHILESEGVIVRRPDEARHQAKYGTPAWESTGMYAAMPRDVLLVVGDKIIECPTAWRSRYYETHAYRRLLKDYFRRGARWAAAPKPELIDFQYDSEWCDTGELPPRLVITEFEPTFDAADFVRLGRDIIAQRSNVTNDFGIDWLRRELGDEYNIHVLEFADSHPMHLDATLLPLAPGKLLINPERVLSVPKLFADWDIIEAPLPDRTSHTLYFTSRWINMNVLMLDEKRVMVEASDEAMIATMRKNGFEPIPCAFRNFNSFGGSFHCATLDIRRTGSLESYLGKP